MASGYTVLPDNFPTLPKSYFNQFGPKWCFLKLWMPCFGSKCTHGQKLCYEIASTGPSQQFICNKRVCKRSVLGPRSSAAKITLLCQNLSGDQMNTWHAPNVQQIKGKGSAVTTAQHLWLISRAIKYNALHCSTVHSNCSASHPHPTAVPGFASLGADRPIRLPTALPAHPPWAATWSGKSQCWTP